jgi:mobilome CxxCx(11)CxxC protein
MAEEYPSQYEEDKHIPRREYTGESEADRKGRLIETCKIRAVNYVQKAWVFDKRGRRYRFGLKVLAFSGVVVPAVVGSIVVSFAAGVVGKAWFTYVLAIAGVFSVAQILLALVALSAKWDDAHAYATESASANRALYRKYMYAAQFHPKKIEEFELLFERLANEYQCRRDYDDKQGLTETEKRIGYRAGLLEVELECPRCKKIPTSMSPSDCNRCGNFPSWQLLRLGIMPLQREDSVDQQARVDHSAPDQSPLQRQDRRDRG